MIVELAANVAFFFIFSWHAATFVLMAWIFEKTKSPPDRTFTQGVMVCEAEISVNTDV